MAVAAETAEMGTEAAAAAERAGAARSAADHVVPELEALCDALGPGGRVPTHTELMRRFGASERAVREALERLRRSGRIVRRQGSGTFVAGAGGGGAVATLPLPAPTGARAVVAVGPVDHSFFDRSLDLFCDYAEAADLSPILKPVRNTGADAQANLARSLAGADVGGFLIAGYLLEPVARALHESGARVVLFGTPPVDVTRAPFPIVCGDQEYGGYLVTRHLVEIGHRRLAVVQAGAGALNRQRRFRGHDRALREARRAGVEVAEVALPEEETETWEADPARAAAYFAAPDAPTALVAWNDHEAARLLRALTRAGVSVPGRVSLAGYDALPEGALVYPPLTTVDPAAGQQIRFAIDLLTADGPAPASQQTVFAPTLVVRESTAAPPRPDDAL